MATRRDALHWFLRALAATGAAAASDADARLAGAGPPGARSPPPSAGEGYGRDPDLLHPSRPWPLRLDEAELREAAALADALLPADGTSPAASALGVHDFLNEWISAPYPVQVADRGLLNEGLERFRRELGVPRLSDAPAERVAAALAAAAAAEPGSPPETFFRRLRRVCLIGYYTSDVGAAEIGWRGGEPMASFPPPPAEVLKRLGLA